MPTLAPEVTQKQTPEKRRHPRFPVGLTMDIHAKGSTIGKCRGTIADLSLGGMSFKTNAELEEGMCLYLKLDVPLEIRGEVRHIQGAEQGGMHSYGVRFHKIGFGEEAGRPEKFVSARIEKQENQ